MSKIRDRRTLGNFLRNRSGAFAIQFALMVIPIMGCVGLAVDGGRAFLARFELAQALDAAALAIGSTIDPDQDLDVLAAKFVEQNFHVAGADDVVLDLDSEGDVVTLSGTVQIETYFMPLFGHPSVTVGASSEVRRGGADVEVALVLDTTGSMDGAPLAALKVAAADLVNTVVSDVQEPFFSKVALVSFANGVHVGAANAANVRGPITAGKTISAAAWKSGATKTITGITKANPAVVTSTAHGFANGDTIYITGVSGMTNVNSKSFVVAGATANTFQLSGVNSSSYSNWTSGGTIQKCLATLCDVVVTSSNHGFADGAYVYVSGVSGMTQINSATNTAWRVKQKTANTFALTSSNGPGTSAYTSGGTGYCTTLGCEYFRFTSAWPSTRVSRISNCVTERIGAEAYTDAPPSTSYVGYSYAAGSNNSCATNNKVVPLTATKSTLTTAINSLTATNSTAGEIGLAWGWYLVSPNWGYLWSNAENRPEPYAQEDLVKVVVMMTDGEFNTAHCNGAPSKNYAAGSNSERINCNATNGKPFDQANSTCSNMKEENVVVYTVGFDLAAGGEAETFMTDCATDSDHAFLTSTTAELTQAFQQIATSITLLRLSK